MPTQNLHSHWAVATQHPWLFLAGIVAITLIGWWTYRRQDATPGLKHAMALLRAVILAIVVLLLARPILVSYSTVRTESVIAIWLDSSSSMSLRDPYRNAAMRQLLATYQHQLTGPSAPATATQPARRPSRYELATWQLDIAAQTWLGELARRQQVAIFTGGGQARLLGIAANPTQLKDLVARLKQHHPTADTTNVPAVIHGILQQLQGRPVSSIIVLSDGRSTAGEPLDPAITEARTAALNVFALPVGETHEPFDLALEQTQAPRHAFVQDPIAVRAQLRVTAAAGVLRTQVELLRQASPRGVPQKIASRWIVIPPGHKPMPLEMIFHPGQPGHYHLMLRVKPVPGELTYRNNHSGTLTTDVVNAKIRILYVDGYPRWEYRYLKNDLMREPTTRLSCLLLSADNRFAQEGNIPINHFPDTAAQLDRYDVLLLGDVDPDYFSAAQEKLIRHFVGEAGGGLGLIAGPRYMPAAYRDTPLAELLPVLPGDPGNPALAPPSPEPFQPHLTAAGRQSPLFQFFDSRKKNIWQVAHLSPLYWFQPVAGLAPSGVVLADDPAHTINGQPAPLLVFGRYGAGRTMFSAMADTWRWRYYHGAPLYISYWLQMVRQLARARIFDRTSNAASGLVLSSDTPQALAGHGFSVRLKVRDKALADQMPRQVRLVVSGPGGTQGVDLVPTNADHKLYTGTLTLWKSGRYSITPAGTLPASIAPLHIHVTRSNLEFRDLRADITALTQLASATGGRVIALPQAAKLGPLIPDRSVQTIHRQTRQLWNQPFALALLVILLTGEWILRKHAGLI